MSQVIWKYELPGPGLIVPLEIPKGAKPLSVGVQRDSACLWALVDPEQEGTTFRFGIYATGEPLPSHPGEYLGTLLLAGGSLVYHVFCLDI